MIAVVVFTDGRAGCIEDTIESAVENLHGMIERRLINDDSGDAGYRRWLLERFAPFGFELVPPADERQGFGGAIRWTWDRLRSGTSQPFIFHLEDDFTFNRPVDLNAMAHVLQQHPHLVQLALRRQPWNDDERAAGGIIEQHPDDYGQVRDEHGRSWLEHRRFFTTNPSMYRRSLLEHEWPAGDHSEGMFGQSLTRDWRARFGFWGDRSDDPWVTHIGAERVGSGY